MTQIISKDGRVICVTTVPYPAWIVKEMKQAGYKIQETSNKGRKTDD